MKHLLSILLSSILLLVVTAKAQTIRTLGYNTTNGQVVANTGTNVLTFMNDVKFGGGDIIITANSIFWSGHGIGINFEEGAFISGNTNYQWRFDMPFYFTSSTFEATTRANLGFSTNLNTLWTATNAASARTNLGLPLPALTNTSNVTMMRALAGSTNTNEPYSGTFESNDGVDNYYLTFSNGILVKREGPL